MIGIRLNVVKHRTNEGLDNSEAPNKKSKKGNCTQQSETVLCIPGRRIARTIGNVRRSILKKSGKGPRRAHLELNYTKTAEGFINIREQQGPSLGVIQGGRLLHHRSANAPAFADRDPNYTLWAEDDARKAAWQRAKTVVQNSRNIPGERSFSLLTKDGMCEVAAVSNVNPDEREFIVDACASMHMMSTMGIDTRRIGKLSKCLDFPPL